MVLGGADGYEELCPKGSTVVGTAVDVGVSGVGKNETHNQRSQGEMQMTTVRFGVEGS